MYNDICEASNTNEVSNSSRKIAKNCNNSNKRNERTDMMLNIAKGSSKTYDNKRKSDKVIATDN